MPGLIDTHAHLCDASFSGDLDAVLERAGDAGVEAVIAVGENLDDARRNVRLAAEFPGLVRAAAGLFPTVLDRNAAGEVTAFIRAHGGRWIAIGEVGLDLWKVQDEEGRSLQREIFIGFIRLARELSLPLNVHSRSAGRQAIELLLDEGAERVQLHAFDGRAATAHPAVEAGYFFSVPPSAVRSRQKQKLVARLPLESLLLETDSPVLGPDTESRNEPANVRVSLAAISQIKGVPLQQVAEQVRENTLRLYPELGQAG